MCNLDFTPNAYLARRRFECDGGGNLFLYSKLETPPLGANARGRHQCGSALSCDEGFPAAQGASSEKPHACTKCGKAFCRSALMVHHGVHTGERSFACSERGRGSREKVCPDKQGTQTKEKPGRDGRRGKTIFQRAGLCVPGTVHAGAKPYRCSECEKTFSHKSRLIEHRRSHTGVKPYGCRECGRSFSRKSCLLINARIHTGEKPYGYRECGPSFSRKSCLLIHARIHTGEKRYGCGDCGKAFFQKSYLILHRRTHTRGSPMAAPSAGTPPPRTPTSCRTGGPTLGGNHTSAPTAERPSPRTPASCRTGGPTWGETVPVLRLREDLLPEGEPHPPSPDPHEGEAARVKRPRGHHRVTARGRRASRKDIPRETALNRNPTPP
ncbi:zinc finger protein 239-like [Theropithecus gelada]|uniref:zinc finger protein 239-like n=1 Tax=Theropithecus gelada TaxID=9565 RepID=UPI000DC17ED6|nr:zinc finger protein 239-like [Theropithecus gelada]